MRAVADDTSGPLAVITVKHENLQTCSRSRAPEPRSSDRYRQIPLDLGRPKQS